MNKAAGLQTDRKLSSLNRELLARVKSKRIVCFDSERIGMYVI